MSDAVADFVIIGAGIFGASLAYHLAAASRSVHLIERHSVASGASGGPGHRGVRANNRDLRELPLAARAVKLWPEWSEKFGQDSGYERVGGLSVGEQESVSGKAGKVTLKARAAVQNAFGIRTEILDAEAVKALLPQISDKVRYALFNPDDGIADHTVTTRAFSQAAVALGAVLEEGQNVVKVFTDRERCGVVQLHDGRELKARQAVILAANTQVPKLLAEAFEIELPIWPFNPQVAQIKVGAEVKIDQLVNHQHRTLSIKRADRDHLTVTGGAVGHWDEDTETGVPDLSVLSASLQTLAAVFPTAAVGAQVTHLEAGRADSSSADQIPIIDQVPGEPIFYATGWSGHGFAISPAVSEAVAEWLIKGTKPSVLNPFSEARFRPQSIA
ncbi:FAD-binding oxidoreductase [Brucella sp. NBRC 12950]|uniref:NAD(P)/FAD-dependent oxidoreductase n=1 Tax=Brucella sp. NBRC 12950 TaxID=2994518 RepID=UPI0024A342C1|nr:FAD-binding oxidoreductase [Brucella sp. NBRC 12950]GLU29157.1 oxidoreductase [Brucella sp. NBRC 12950]